MPEPFKSAKTNCRDPQTRVVAGSVLAGPAGWFDAQLARQLFYLHQRLVAEQFYRVPYGRIGCMRFNVSTLLIATTFLAGLLVAAKYGVEAVGDYVAFGCAGLLYVWGTLAKIRDVKANNEGAKCRREGD